MPDVPTPQVLVVGAGPVGLTLAVSLLRHGVPCRIVDLGHGPSTGAKASVVQARTLEIFDELGIAEPAIARGRKVRGLQLYAQRHPVAHFTLDGMDTLYAYILGLGQRDTELLLREQLTRLGGAVEHGTRLLSLQQDDTGVSVELSHEAAGAAPEQARFAWVVGCDGAGSTVRGAIGLTLEGQFYDEAVLQADVRIAWAEPLPDEQILAFFTPEGLIAVLPLLDDGRYRILALAPAGADEPTLPAFQALMDARGPGGAVLSDPSWIVRFPIQRRLAPSYRVGRVFLAGDAAHLQSPLSGQGMNLGIQDAYNLSWKLGLVLRGAAPAALLDSYEAERRPAADETLQLADDLTGVFQGFMRVRSAAAQAQRDHVLHLLSDRPDFHRRVAQGAGMLLSDYRQSPAVDEVRFEFAAGPGAGEHALDAPLPLPLSGGARWLHELVRGPRHSLLWFGGGHGEPEVDDLEKAAAEVAARHGAELRQHVIVLPQVRLSASLLRHATVVLDEDGSLHRLYGASNRSVYVIRPDQYVAFRSKPADTERLLIYLGRWLVPARSL